MHDTGYAIYLTDSVTAHPIAIFSCSDVAGKWAEANYPGRHRIERIDWQIYESKFRTMAIGQPKA